MPTYIKRFIALVIVVLVAGYMANEIWQHKDSLMKISWGENVGAIIIHVCALFMVHALLGLGWYQLLKSNGTAIDFRSLLQCFYLPNLGKYTPGKVLFFAGRIELVCRLNINIHRTRAALLFLIETALLLFFSLLLSIPSVIKMLGFNFDVLRAAYTIMGLAIVFMALKPAVFLKPINAVLVIFKKAVISSPPSIYTMSQLLFIYLLVWVFYAVSGIAIVSVFCELSMEGAIVAGSAFVCAWLIGFISIMTPAGLGVREGILLLLLQPILPAHEAVLVAIIARLFWTLSEMSLACVALLFSPKTMNKV